MDTDSIPRSVFLIFILIIAGGLFAAAETAVSNCSRVRLLSWADDDRKGAKRAIKVLDKFDKAIITLLIGTNAVHVVAASVATVMTIGLVKSQELGSAISTVAMTLLIFVFSETIPKNIAKARSDEALCFFSGPLWVLMIVLTPVDLLFMGLSKVLKLLFRSKGDAPAMTEDDFTTMIETIEDEGVLEADESELIQSAVEFTDRKVSEILMPRVKIVGLDLEDSDEENFNRIVREKYTRLPVYIHDMDHIVGILNTKQYLQQRLKNPDGYPSVKALMAKPYYIKPDMGLHTLVEEMRRRQNHLAIVKDEWGGTEGLVTLEDLLEELVGDIWDEDEKEEARAAQTDEEAAK